MIEYSQELLDQIVEKERIDAFIRIVDDESSTRRALGFMLQLEGYSTRIYDSAESFLNNDDTTLPGCVILDVRMPGLTGLELQREMISRNIDLPVIFVTGYADIDVAVESMRRGAVDFLLKPVESEKLLHAIRWALHADRLRRQPSPDTRSPDDINRILLQLTGREIDVLRLITKGITNSQAAVRLGISERTIEGHRLRIYRKFGVHTDSELMTFSSEINNFLNTTQIKP